MKNICENCGNQYDKAFKIIINDKEHIFDSFECAINKVAPHCEHCDSIIIGHGVESNGHMFCCAHCASRMGYTALVDRAESSSASTQKSEH